MSHAASSSARAHRYPCSTPAGLSRTAPLAAHEVYGEDVAAAGVVAGIGRVEGVECMIIANDATVKGGTYYPLTVKKTVARENRLPCIYPVDSAAPTCRVRTRCSQTASTSAASSSTSQHERHGHSADRRGDGPCTAGGATCRRWPTKPSWCATRRPSFAGPPLVKAATGEVVTAEELGGADVHCKTSGVADHYAENDEHALSIARRCVANLNWRKLGQLQTREPRALLYAADELYGVIPAQAKQPYDVREVIARLVDGSEFDEFKALFGTTGLRLRPSARLPDRHPRQQRHPSPRRRRKARTSSSWPASAASRCCSCRTSPVSWSGRNTRPAASPSTAPSWSPRWPAPGAEVHRAHRRQLRCRQLRHVRRAYDPRFLDVAQRAHRRDGWRTGRRGARPVKQEQSERAGKSLGDDEVAAIKQPILEQYERRGHPYYSSARLWDDGVIDPAQTREVLGWRCPPR